MSAQRAAFIRERFGLRVEDIDPIGEGWDSDTYEVDGRWIFRFPRRPEVEERMGVEIRLVAELADALTVPVPRFEFVSLDPLCVGYRRLAGEPLPPDPPAPLAADVARFLSELHALSPAQTVLGADDPNAWRADLREVTDDFRERVFPLLPRRERRAAAAMFDDFLEEPASFAFAPAIVHADLGPEHLLWDGERLTAVIDWSDARPGDPAIDFAWLLHGPGQEFASELARHYLHRIDESFRRRARFFHRLGPWYEVTYGLDLSKREYVESGLAGVRQRLPENGPRMNIRPVIGR